MTLPTILLVLSPLVTAPEPLPTACPNPTLAWPWVLERPAVRDLLVTSDDSVVVVGSFAGEFDFDPGPGVDLRASAGEQDAFIAQLHADGSYVWTHTFEGPGASELEGVAEGKFGHILMVGAFSGVCDLDPGDGADVRASVDDPTYEGLEFNAFVTALAADGMYAWSAVFGGGLGGSSGDSIAVDSQGNVCAVGTFYGTVDLDPGPSTRSYQSNGVQRDAYVLKLDATGNFVWAQTFGGTGSDGADDVAVDSQGNLYVLGTFRGAVDFDPGPGVDRHVQQGQIKDVFLLKLAAGGSYAWTRTWPVWFRFSGRFSLDADDHVLITGLFGGSVDFDPTDRTDVQTSPAEGYSAFVTKLRSDGSYVWTRTFESTGFTFGTDVVADASGAIFVAGGYSDGTDFDPGPGIDEREALGPPGYPDSYVTKLTPDGESEWTRTIGAEFSDEFWEITSDSLGALVVGSFLDGAMDFDPGCAESLFVPETNSYAVLKLACPEPRADVDKDGDVDLRDLAHFANCFTGADAQTCNRGCPNADFDTDDDIDLDDFAGFASQMASRP